MTITAREVMTSNPSFCRDIDTVDEAVRLMQKENCGAVPVVNDREELVGIVTDRDICLRVVLEHLDPGQCELLQVMTTGVVACRADDAMEDVLSTMKRMQVRRIPVVDDYDRCIGIITESDLARSELASRLPEVIQASVSGNMSFI